jgi:ABC-type glucose/galactose transport system permease subunit
MNFPTILTNPVVRMLIIFGMAGVIVAIISFALG